MTVVDNDGIVNDDNVVFCDGIVNDDNVVDNDGIVNDDDVVYTDGFVNDDNVVDNDFFIFFICNILYRQEYMEAYTIMIDVQVYVFYKDYHIAYFPNRR